MGVAFPILAALGGMGLQMAGAKKASGAENRAMASELARQQEYARQGQAAAAESLARSTPQVAQQQIASGAQQRESAYKNAQAIPLSTSAAASPLSFRNADAQGLTVGARTALDNASAARLGGYSEWDLQQALKNLQVNQQLGTINNFARGSSSILPGELESASHAGDSLSGLGSLLGTVGMLYGLSKLGAKPQTPARYSNTPRAITLNPNAGASVINWNPINNSPAWLGSTNLSL